MHRIGDQMSKTDLSKSNPTSQEDSSIKFIKFRRFRGMYAKYLEQFEDDIW